MWDKSILKRLDALEKEFEDMRESNYLDVLIIRKKEELKRYEGQTGPDTKIIHIVPARKRVGA
jgi:hypothetical protein